MGFMFILLKSILYVIQNNNRRSFIILFISSPWVDAERRGSSALAVEC